MNKKEAEKLAKEVVEEILYTSPKGSAFWRIIEVFTSDLTDDKKGGYS